MNIAAAMVNVTMLIQFASLLSSIRSRSFEYGESIPVQKTNCEAESLIDKHIGIIHDRLLDWSNRDHLCQGSHNREDYKTCNEECQ